MGNFNGTIESINENKYAGIKLYPPLGFDPWPDNKRELEKSNYFMIYVKENKFPLHVIVVMKVFPLKTKRKWRN